MWAFVRVSPPKPPRLGVAWWGPVPALNLFPILPIELYEGFSNMPTVDQYAASIVEKYQIIADTGSPSHRVADEIVPLVKQWGKQYLLGITVSGAYAQGTAVSLSSHVDLLVTLSPVPNMEMKQVFWSLFEYLTDQELKPRTRNVSVQLERKGLFVDVIPAYRDGNSSGSVLFNKKTGRPVQTDVAQHVHLVSNSGRQQEICAVKIWRERNALDFPSLYLELSVLRALETERFGQLADNVIAVMRYLSSRFEKAVIRDPANAENVVSNDLTPEGRQMIAKAARGALYDENWKKIVW